jgi:hypothetical protein
MGWKWASYRVLTVAESRNRCNCRQQAHLRASARENCHMPDAAKTLETFSFTGAAVAILTDAMTKTLRLALPLLVAFALPAVADEWSVGGGTGAFVFGDFVRRTLLPTTGNSNPSPSRIILTGKTRPGILADVERDFSDRFAVGNPA